MAEAEACFLRALDLARTQGSKVLELRAASSLARLWHRRGRAGDARRVLADAAGWFTEGVETKALDSAKAFGAVVGKAMRPLVSGQGLIPILIALQ